MQFGEAFLSLIPQLDNRAVGETQRQAHAAGERVGKEYAQGVDKGASKGTGSTSAFGQALAVMGAKATIGAAGVASVAPAALQLTAAVLPASGAILGLVGAQLALKAVTGVVKLAVLGVGDAIEEGFTGTAKEAEEAISKLPPQAQSFARSIIALKGPLDNLRASTSDGLFAPINEELDKTTRLYLPVAQRQFPAIAEAVGNTGAMFLVAARQGMLFDGVNLLLGNTAKSIQIANDATIPLTNGLGALVQVGARGLPTLATGFANAGTAAGNFLVQAEKTGQLDQWMQAGFKTIGQLIEIIKNLGSVLMSVLQKAGESNRNFLGTIVDITAKMAAFFKSVEGSRALENFFTVTGAISTALRQGLMLILPEIGRTLAILAPAVQPLIAGFLSLVAAVAPLLPVAARLAVVLASVLAGAMTTLAGVLTPMIAKLTGGGSAGEGMEKLMASAEKLGPAVNDAASSVQSLTPALNLTATAIAFMVEHTDTLIKFLPLIAAGFIAWKVAQIAGNIAMAASVPIRIAEIVAMRQQTAALTQLAIAQGVATGTQVANTGATVTGTAATVGQRIAALASAVAQRAVAAATAIWTGAQWLLNAALTANPIGIVVVAIAALVAAIVIAYKNSETFRDIVDACWRVIKVAIEATVNWFVNTAWPALKTVLDALGVAFNWLWKNVLVPVWNGIKLAIDVAWVAIKVVFAAIEAYIKVLQTVFMWLWKNVIEPVWQGIHLAIQVAWVAIQIIFKAVEIALKVMGMAFQLLWTGVIVPVWNGIKAATQLWWTGVQAIFNAVMAFIRGPLATAFNWFKSLIDTIWNAVKAATQAWWSGIQAIFNAVMAFIRGPLAAAWNWFKSLIDTVWNAIKSAIQAAWNFIKGNVLDPLISYIKGPLLAAWNAAKSGIISAWEAIKGPIQATWNFLKSNIFDPLANMITKTIPNAFSTGVNAVKSAWEKIKEAAAAPVRFVVNTVINGGIIKGFNWIADKVGVSPISPISLGFASGGVLPGYSPGRDVHKFVSPTGGRLDLSGGEAIMRPEFTKALGTNFINAANSSARAGGSRGVKEFMTGFLKHGDNPQYANGGVFGHQKFAEGGVLGGIVGGISKAWNAFTDPVETFKSMVTGLMGGMPGGPFIKDVLGKTVSKLIDGVGAWISEKFAASSAAMGGEGGPGNWEAMWNWVKSRFPGTSLFSGFRNSTTLSGNKSLHASGRAIDVTPNRAISNAIISTFGSKITELISPWKADHVWHGQRPHDYGQALDAQHGVYGNNAHIHWAMKNGGVFKKYDKGGWFNPGDIGVNKLRQPEAVLTPAESTGLKALGTDEISKKLDRLIEAIEKNGHTVGGYIRGSGKSLVARSRQG